MKPRLLDLFCGAGGAAMGAAEAQVAALTDKAEYWSVQTEKALEEVAALTQSRDEWHEQWAAVCRRAEAAEAALAEAIHERDMARKLVANNSAERWNSMETKRAQRLEAALANTRQALEWIATTSPDRAAQAVARRALAAGDNTTEPA